MSFLQNKKIEKVSVIIPNYNYKKYIKKRIQSVLRQTYPIYEIIILDDKSNDGSDLVIEKMISKLETKNPSLNIKFIKNNKNSGSAIKQWRKGFELATGDFVWIAEADDLCSSRFLEEAMKGFNDLGVLISYTESRIINASGLIISPNFRWSRDKEKTGHYKKDYIKDGRKEIEEIMAIRCTIPNVSGVVFRKKSVMLYEKILKEAEKFSQVGDWYFYSKILRFGKISYRKKPLNYFRVHGGSVTDKSKNSQKHYDEIADIHKMFLRDFNLSPAVKTRMIAEQKRYLDKMENKNG